jgi:hypothetical protein
MEKTKSGASRTNSCASLKKSSIYTQQHMGITKHVHADNAHSSNKQLLASPWLEMNVPIHLDLCYIQTSTHTLHLETDV